MVAHPTPTLRQPARPDRPSELIELGRTPPLATYLRMLWARRELVLALPLSRLKAQNRDSVLGGAWHLLNPLLLAGVYYVIFGVIFDAGRRGGIDNYVGFLTIGVFTYHYTSKSVVAGSKAIVANEGLIRSIRFPRAVLPISAVLGETFALGYAIAAMILFVVATGEPLTWYWLLIIPLIATQFCFNLGLAFIVSRLTSHFRDMEQILPFVLRLWLYFSGVFFVINDRLVDHPILLNLLQFNPAHAFLSLMREALLDATTSGRYWATVLGWTILLFGGGFAFFRSREASYGG